MDEIITQLSVSHKLAGSADSGERLSLRGRSVKDDEATEK